MTNYKPLPYNPNLKKLAAKNRTTGNPSEVLLWGCLRGKKLNGLSFQRQKIVGNYIADFFCANRLVAVEIDGESHDRGFNFENGKIRDDFLLANGVSVIHVSDSEVKRNLDGVVKYLENTPALRATPLEEGFVPYCVTVPVE